MKSTLVILIWQGPGPVTKKCHFFCRNSIHRKVFQLQLPGKKPVLPLWEISSKMLDNFPIKLSHLYLTSRDVWLSSSTCGHYYAYHLICIWNWKPQQVRLRVVPHLSSGIVEWMRMKITPREKRRHSLGRGKFSLYPLRLAFLVWGDFHGHLRFARSTISEGKWGTTHSLTPPGARA